MFLAGPGLLDALDAGATYVLTGAEARHAAVVQRRRPGERVDVVDTEGVRLRCRIVSFEGGSLTVAVEERVVEPAPAVRLVLAQALAKGDRDERAIEAATEVGVDEVVPWQAGRSVVVWRGDRAAKSRARWLATVREAAKQSRRAHVPLVAEPVDTRGLASCVQSVCEHGGLAVVLAAEAGVSLGEVPLPTPSGEGAVRVLVVVGPEGGIAPEELDELITAGAVPARLGPHVLRTSTAGPVALGLLAERSGRWA